MRYEIRVEGLLDPRWSEWFEGMHLRANADGTTTIAGPVADQAALHGLLGKVRDLGLPLIAVWRVGPNHPERKGDEMRKSWRSLGRTDER